MTTLSGQLKNWGNRLWPQRFHPFSLAERKVRRAAMGRVLAGPFAGMKLAPASVGSAFMPKLLGTYERELNPLIEEFCAHNFETIVNIGAAEGYFAVGMALRCPKARVHAFEADPEGVKLMREMMALNEVSDRVEAHGYCTGEALGALLRQHPGALVIMDVEGGEAGLLTPDLVPPTCRILVELHEFIAPGIGKEIAMRFSLTHSIREFHTRERSLADLPLRSVFLDRWLLKLTREFRPAPMSWYDLAGNQLGGFSQS